MPSTCKWPVVLSGMILGIICLEMVGCQAAAETEISPAVHVASPEQGADSESTQIIAGLAKVEKDIEVVTKTVNKNVDEVTSWILAASLPALCICGMAYYTLKTFWKLGAAGLNRVRGK